MLSPFSPTSGGTWVVPGSHRDHRNPRGEKDGIDQFKPIANEMQVEGRAGSVVMMDTRIWHSNAANLSREPRIALVVRYAPWWLSAEYGGRNQAIVPRATYEALPPKVKILFRHRAEGVENKDVSVLTPE